MGKRFASKREGRRALLIVPFAACMTLGRHIWVRPPGTVPVASCEILNRSGGEKGMDFEDIWFCRCGVVDKALPGKTAEHGFISSTVGLKHSQTSWYTLAALM